VTAEASPQLKEEPMFRNEKCSVSWHADSTLGATHFYSDFKFIL
jgi:hypothetical protein